MYLTIAKIKMKKSKIATCRACSMLKQGVKSRIAFKHTCGKEPKASPMHCTCEAPLPLYGPNHVTCQLCHKPYSAQYNTNPIFSPEYELPTEGRNPYAPLQTPIDETLQELKSELSPEDFDRIEGLTKSHFKKQYGHDLNPRY